VGDSLIEAPSLMLGKLETMYKAQSNIVGFLCTLDFVLALPDDSASSQH
jgi:hypothetical protein